MTSTSVDDRGAGAAPAAPVAAVLFDLDDTLFAQADWLAGAWEAVVAAATPLGVAPAPFAAALTRIAAGGSDRGRIIDRALDAVGAGEVPVASLVAAFRAYRAPRLSPFPGVARALARLRRRVPIGLVTDGDPSIQRGKLTSLRLVGSFDVVVYSDQLGREHRKPDPLPFHVAASRLGAPVASTVVVGDRPAKDVAGALAAGMRPVRVRTGEYAGWPDDPPAWRTVDEVGAAIDLVSVLVPRSTARWPSLRGRPGRR